MKKIFILSGLIFLLFIPTTALAWGVEIAGGAWYQSPSGNLSFDKTTHADDLDLEDDLNYDDKWQPSGRLKIDMPLFIPNIYIMATPMKWDESGSKDVSFKFGGQTFSGGVDFDSKLKMNHLDVALFYGLPFIKTATAGVLNIDLGLNFRLLDVKAEIKQTDLGLKESESYFLPLPMVYGAMQIVPVDWLGLEFEGRGSAYSSNYYVSLIGRLKVKPFGPFFVAGGYRYDTVKIDYQDIDIDTEFQGPFAEAGLDF
ncbi:MAG: TIGR04219 family outer membrane beta-barrel protein [Proteobacteria bacterium]|nr:TIGR04219 family outer membrane beta-barrel protein [Pseudomonadota bacterium]